MPTYEYTCQNCGHEMEAFQRMSEDPLEICPSCEAPALRRKIGRGAGIIFKGGGFYETDFKDKKGSPPETPKKEDAGTKQEAARESPAKAESPAG